MHAYKHIHIVYVLCTYLFPFSNRQQFVIFLCEVLHTYVHTIVPMETVAPVITEVAYQIRVAMFWHFSREV